MTHETVFDRGGVTVVRLNGRPRSGVDGRHRRLVGYCDATMSTPELVRLLRDTAESLSKTLPRSDVG